MIKKHDSHNWTELPDTPEKLLKGRRTKLLCQEEMAAYLKVSGHILNRMEEDKRTISPEIADKAFQILNRYGRDCFSRPHALVYILAKDGYSIQSLASASGLSVDRIKAMRRGNTKVLPEELEALLGIPPRPHRTRKAKWRSMYGW